MTHLPAWSTLFLAIALIILVGCRPEQPQHASAKPADRSSTVYDSLTAQAYGADDYGMKKYVMAFLKKGPNRDLDSLSAAKLQMAHLNNIGKMAEEGKLVLAGPFLDEGDIRGIYIFNVGSIEEAEVLTNTDPAIKAGSLVMELKEWYGSAGLMAINELHKRLAKSSITAE